ncbi:MAG: shikimate kinase [Verrucomicrobia bacterium]|nr:shikimate kinase [Verrucomicrobiota bacterium]
MIETRRIDNISLVGFMGTGKTSVGHHLAAMLRFRFLDTDELIERRAGKRISTIFSEDGEPAFRKLEAEVVEELGSWKHTIISTGGGLVTHSDNMPRLKTRSLVVCLWASPNVIWKRVRLQSNRPLLNTPDPLARITELLAEREPFYRQSDILMNTEVRSVKQMAHQVALQFRMIQSKQPNREGEDSQTSD